MHESRFPHLLAVQGDAEFLFYLPARKRALARNGL
jgi:hypothetical protein